MRRIVHLLFWVACIWAPSVMGQNQSLIELVDVNKSYSINREAQILEEPNGVWQINEVIQRHNLFYKPTSDNPNYGLSEKGLWLYSQIVNKSDKPYWVVDVSFAQNDNVDFYLLKNGEVVFESKQGKVTNNHYKRYPVFKIQMDQGQVYDLYVRVYNPHLNRIIPIDIYSGKHFNLVMNVDQTMWGFYYGGLFMLVLYSAVLFLNTRESSVVAYVFYLINVILFELVWGGHLHLFLNSPTSQWLMTHTDLVFSLTAFSAGCFALSFLEASNSAPKATGLVKIFLGLEFFLVILSAIDLFPSKIQNYLVYFISIGAIFSYLRAGIESYLNHYKPARYFVFAWTILLSCAFVGLLGLIGYLPSNFATTYCFQIGVFIESAFFALAILEKSRHKLETDVQSATEDLMNNLELIEEQNARLDIARKDAVKASHIKSQFLANMSHEIRTPLNAILGFSKELSTLSLPADKQEHVQIINTSATNLLAIVNDVLDFSKIEAGKLRIHQEHFSPTELLEELLFVNSKAARKKGLFFGFDSCPLPQKLVGDPARIKQVLTNLLSNAIKFTQEGYVNMVVRGKVLDKGLYQLEFLVEDSGIGIENKNKSKLFRAFSQLDEALTRSYQGTGLGLVICQQLVQLMKGHISFESLYGVGSSFKVTLTCKQASEEYDMMPDPQWQDKTVVILDRDFLARRSKAKLLTYLGAKVTSVESLDFLASLHEKYDYLLVDALSLNGIKQSEYLRQCKLFPANDKVLLHDNHHSINAIPQVHDIFNRYIEKPLLLSRLTHFFEQEEQDDADIWQQRLASLPAISVLAVDDMELNLKLLKTWLLDAPIDLVLCYSGKEAVSLCESKDFDLILMDVQMPEMDGVEAAKRIRRTRINQGTPIIAVTAHAFREEKERLLNSGMDDYLAKPLDLGSLINTIKRWSIGVEEKGPITSDLPDFEWKLAVDRANGNESIANEMFYDFVEQLSESFAAINHNAENQRWKEMQHFVHRLHGASCYTGVPKLQFLCAECEKCLKLGDVDDAMRYVPSIKQAVEALLKMKQES